ncbi:MAG: hypothetical protein QOG80_2464 [Pseudonocardiales bacterium]|nr:hypothetical protein [Pseudonocardiales bacterium]
MSTVSGSTRRKRSTASVRTLRAMVATALMIVPLWGLFTNQGWLIDAWLAIAVVCVPAAIIRATRVPRVWQTWLGIVLLVPWLTARFVSDHAVGGVLPTRATWSDVSGLLDSVRRLSNDGVAPVHATLAVSFVMSLLAGLLAAFVDLIAVVGRRSAIAGVPILVVFTVVGAVTRHPVSWLLFLASAAAFLLLLSNDAADTVHDWGRVVPGAGEHRGTRALGVSGPRIAVIAVAIAAVVPLIAPSRTSNLIADAFHGGTAGTGPGGFGAGSGTSLDPFAALKGQLQRTKSAALFTVTVSPGAPAPFYLRANVLSNYSNQGWSAGSHGIETPIANTSFDTVPPITGALGTDSFSAHIEISGLVDNTPVFALPNGISGVDDNTVNWSQIDQILTGTRVHRGQVIDERVAQPAPTVAELQAAPDATQDLGPWLETPADLPQQVRDLVAQVTAGDATPYAKARALTDYFTTPSNGFTYSLTTTAGDSGSDLVDFLTNKRGYCQQFAGALGIMLRAAGVPARVVLGYTHGTPDQTGKFTVTTNNAHAWVEAYFDGLGWIPFDATPAAGAAGGATATLPWQRNAPASSTPSSGAPSVTSTNNPTQRHDTTGPASSTGQATKSSAGSVPWRLIAVLGASGVLVALVLVPAGVRLVRRQRRLRAGRRGDPDQLWHELSDTARDLGYVWSPARSPRQVVAWLGTQVPPDGKADSLRTLAVAVERARYAPGPVSRESLVGELRDVEARLRGRRTRTTRLRARLLPASLGWRARPKGRREA